MKVSLLKIIQDRYRLIKQYPYTEKSVVNIHNTNLVNVYPEDAMYWRSICVSNEIDAIRRYPKWLRSIVIYFWLLTLEG